MSSPAKPLVTALASLLGATGNLSVDVVVVPELPGLGVVSGTMYAGGVGVPLVYDPLEFFEAMHTVHLDGDALALLAFKTSGSGFGLENWVDGTDPCADHWVGVTCSTTRPPRVTELDRSKQPPHTCNVAALAPLTSLTKVILWSTSVTGCGAFCNLLLTRHFGAGDCQCR